ncbi:uncharacterized protein [Periplaneta americana]|uniref:uncharacterized protein n=1 Tax=Periplaneta americana TaxID=6978 RepID=UPI0037E95DD2
MDDTGRSQELLESVEMVTQMRTDVVKLSTSTAGTVKGDEEGEPPPELISAQYINIHRVSDTLSKGLVDCGSPAPPTLMSGELMQHHVVHGGMVVDMMVPPPTSAPADFSQHSPLDRTTLPQYMPDHYDAEDDLLTHDLTEEDRRLAAALVAVQLVQQQKQQHHHTITTSESNVIVSPGGLPGLITTTGHLGTKVQVPVSIGEHHHITTMAPMSPVSGVPVDKPAMAAMVSSYIQAVEEEAAAVANSTQQQLLEHHQGERIMKMYQPQAQHQEVRLPPLPPLKKVLSSHSMAIRSRYVRPHLQDVTQRQQVIQQETELGTRLQQGHQQTVLIEETSVNVADDDEGLKEEYDVKIEGLEDDLGDESDEPLQDDNDSDYDIESDLRPSRKSLPHKKRIPRKLKNLKKAASPSRSIHAKCYKCMKCGEQFGTQAAYTAHRLSHNTAKKMFSCELCGKGFANQLKFFEHLKSHYEPTITTTIVETIPVAKPSNHKEKSAPMKEESEVKEERENKQPAIVSTVGALPPPLICPQCGKTFRRQKAFETHINLAHPKQEEIEEFSEPEDLMEGIRGVVDVGGVDTSDEADIECLPSPAVVRGLKNNNDKEWYREEDLHAAEADLQEMEEQHHQQQQQHHHHLHPHLEEPDNICELCGDVYETKIQLEQHVRTDHLEFTPDPGGRDEMLLSPKRRLAGKRSRRGGLHLTCPQCGRMFNHRNSLVYHLRSHSGERPHQCEVCGKSFFAASALKVHMRLHSGDKPYKCEFCGRHFRQWGDLKYHCISIHSEEKNYQCEYCGKDFARKYSLIVHRRIHTGEKNYKCEFCGKSFRASSYLQNHRRIHTGEKPHPCEVCGKPFRVRSDMKRHLNTHNRDRHRGSNGTSVSTTSGNGSDIHHSLLHGQPKLEEHDPELDPDQLEAHGSLPPSHTITVEHQAISGGLNPVAEITIQPEGGGPESILPDESLGDPGVDQQPINLNIAVPAVATRQAHAHQLSAAAQAVSEEVLHYTTRDPLETVRDGNNTLYVWPIYMT